MILTPQRMLCDLRFGTTDTQDTSSYPAGYEMRKLDQAQDELCDELLLADPLILADYYDLTLTGAERYYLPTYIPRFNFETILQINDITDDATLPGKTISTAWRDRVNIVDGSLSPEYEGWSVIDNNIEFPGLPSSGKMRIWYTHRPVGFFYATLAADAGNTDVTFPTSATDGDIIFEDDYYNGMKIYSGGQVRRITDFVGSTRVATITPAWTTNPVKTTGVIELISPLPDRYHNQIVLRAIRSVKNQIDDDDSSILREITAGSEVMKMRMGKREKQGPEYIRQIERF
jgi:hypothetical protein